MLKRRRHPCCRRTRRRARGCVSGLALLLLACSDGTQPAGPTPPPSALRFSSLSAGYFHTCAVTPAGTAYCWGGNAFGTLGDGSRTDRDHPARVASAPAFTSLDAGAGHNCALAASGAAWCWGQNDEGQLGDGSFAARTAPVTVTGNRTFVSVSAGHAHSCALTASGDAWCWGDDSRGQLGDGGAVAPGKSPLPVRVATALPFAVVVAGYYQTCALTPTGAAWCWGMNGDGQLGDATTNDRSAPVPVGGGHVFTAIDVGDRFACGISSRETWCWGANRVGELGTTAPPATTPVRLSTPPARAVTASAGSSTIPATEPYGCVLDSADRAACWGGAVGSLRARGPAGPLDDRIRAQVIAAGAQHICLLSTAGYAYCGGANFAGQLGDGSRSARALPVAVAGPGN